MAAALTARLDPGWRAALGPVSGELAAMGDFLERESTVGRGHLPAREQVLRAFEQQTGCPVLVNTSFNVRGEPIVCTPQDAFRCFMGTNMDHLVVGNILLSKSSQDADAVGREMGALALD